MKYRFDILNCYPQSYAENEVSMIIDQEVKRIMLEEFLSYDKITRENDAQKGCVTCPKSHSWFMMGLGIKDNLCTAEVEFLPLHCCLFPSRKIQNSGRVNIHY